MEPGLYVTFFTAGEPSADELPAVGPFDHLVVRPGALVADRRSVSQSGDFGGFRWIEAELELQRALGHEPGGVRRPDLRITAPQGVYLRFASLEGAEDEEPVPELGPYAVIVVTRHGVEADGDAIASRSSTKDRAWVILRGGGRAVVGIIRPDIAFRTRSTNYHPRIHQARLVVPPLPTPPGPVVAVRPSVPTTSPKSDPIRPPDRVVPPTPAAARPEPAVAPPPAPLIRPPVPVVTPPAAPMIRPPAPQVTPRAPAPPAEAPSAPTPRASAPTPTSATASSPQRNAIDDRALLDEAAPLRARLGGSLRTDVGPTQPVLGPQELSRRTARRWAGFVLVGALVLGLGAFGAITLRGALTPGTPGTNAVGIGKAVKGTQFDYTVATASRTTSVGSARAQGTFLIVFVTLTYRGSDRGTLSPTAFRLVDGGGAQYGALSESDPVYQNAGNPGSPLVWLTTYPAGQAVSTPVVFDVDATLRGAQLMILEVPTVRVRLD